MTVGEAICIKDWHIQAENGDRQECKRGETYTISQPQFGSEDVTLFSRYWVKAPKEIFAGWISLTDRASNAAPSVPKEE